jgi:hypothetical protein
MRLQLYQYDDCTLHELQMTASKAMCVHCRLWTVKFCIGQTDCTLRTWTKHRQSLKQGLIGDIEINKHVYEERHHINIKGTMVLETVTDKICRKQKALAHLDCIASPINSLVWIYPILEPCHYSSCFQHSLSNKFLSTFSDSDFQIRIKSEIWIMYISLCIINTLKWFACSASHQEACWRYADNLPSALDWEEFWFRSPFLFKTHQALRQDDVKVIMSLSENRETEFQKI